MEKWTCVCRSPSASRVDRLFSLVTGSFGDRCGSVGVYLRRVFQRHWYRVDIRAADGGIVLDASSDLRTECFYVNSLFRNYGSGIGVSIVISVLSWTQSTSRLPLPNVRIPIMRLVFEPHLPLQWDIFTAEGLRLLDAEVTRQAMAIGFLNDFKLIIGATISVPPVMSSRPRSETV